MRTLGIRLRSAANVIELCAVRLTLSAVILRTSGFEGAAIEADLCALKARQEVKDLLAFIGDKPRT